MGTYISIFSDHRDTPNYSSRAGIRALERAAQEKEKQMKHEKRAVKYAARAAEYAERVRHKDLEFARVAAEDAERAAVGIGSAIEEGINERLRRLAGALLNMQLSPETLPQWVSDRGFSDD